MLFARMAQAGRTDIGAYEYDTRSGGTATLAYDAAGNSTVGGGEGYQYDAMGRLIHVASGPPSVAHLAGPTVQRHGGALPRLSSKSASE